MFSHAVGLGLFETKKLNWFDDEEWKAFGYILERQNVNELHLTREPLRRFENVNIDEFNSVDIIKSTNVDTVIQIIENLIKEDQNIGPNDIAIIILDDDNAIYNYIDTLSSKLNAKFGWFINRGYENKIKIENSLYISNPNNVKGLEFPFVICITGKVKKTYKYRNILYTMLTRSFIKSYLLLNNNQDITVLEEGLKVINEQKYIKTIEPTEEEIKEIKNKLIGFLKKPQISYEDFLLKIFEDLKIIDEEKRTKIKEAISTSSIEKFDEEKTLQFINNIKDLMYIRFYSYRCNISNNEPFEEFVTKISSV